LKTMQSRTELFAVRLTTEEAEMLLALAERHCSSGAAVVRQGIKQMAEQAGMMMPAKEKMSGGTNSQARAAAQ